MAEFPGHHGWGYDGVYISAPPLGLRRPEGLAAAGRAAHEHRLAVILDVVYNHVGASGVQALRPRSGPTSPPSTRRLGARRSTTTTRTATRSANGSCRAPRAGSATTRSTDCASTRSTRSTTRSAEHMVAALARRVHAVRDDALVIAESGLNDPRVMRTREPRRLRLRRGLGRRLPPRAADAADRRPRGYYAEFGRVAQLAKACSTASRARRQLFGAVPAASRSVRPPTTCRRDGSWCSRRTTTRSAIGRSATGCREPAPAAGARVCAAAVAVRAAAVHGRGVRRAGAVSVLLRPHRQADRRRHARGPAARVRRLRRVRRGGARPPGSGHVRALEADPPSRPGASRPATPSCCQRGGGCPRATPTRSSSTRPPGGCGCARAHSRSSATWRRGPRASRAWGPPWSWFTHDRAADHRWPGRARRDLGSADR